MSIDFKYKSVDGFDKELLLYGEGYMARPVTLTKTAFTNAGLTPDDKGHMIIPQGSYLYGTSGSLLVDPQQDAVIVVPTTSKATITANSSLVITAKAEGAVAYTVALVVGTKRTASVVANSSSATVTLAVDKAGAVTTTYGDVAKMLNEDITANTFIEASMVTGVDPDTVAAAASVTTTGGGDTAVSSDIDGILYHSVDVSMGETTGAMMIAGYVNMDNMPTVPGAAVIAKLPNITFSRID